MISYTHKRSFSFVILMEGLHSALSQQAIDHCCLGPSQTLHPGGYITEESVCMCVGGGGGGVH